MRKETAVLFAASTVLVALAPAGSAFAGSGACCRTDASCLNTDADGCTLVDGEFMGAGTECARITCEGACCFDDNACGEFSRDDCTLVGGMFHGPNTLCRLRCPGRLSQTLTYQGQLKQSGVPYEGLIDVQARLWDTAIGGEQIGIDCFVAEVDVVNGLFQTELFFGSDVFDGRQAWLELEVRPVSDPPLPFTTLSPRQKVTPTPYSLFALRSEMPDGHSLDAVDGDPADAMYVDEFGNAGIGTTTPEALLHLDAGSDHLPMKVDSSAGTILSLGFDGTLRLAEDTDDRGFFVEPKFQTVEVGVFDEGVKEPLLELRPGHVIVPDGVGLGFGTYALNGKIEVQQSLDASNGGIFVTDSQRSKHLRLFVDESRGVQIRSTNSELVLNDGGENVIIGGTDLGFGRLSVQQQQNNSASGIAVINSAQQRSLRIWVDGSNRSRFDSSQNGTHPLALNAGGGYVGVGTADPETQLDARGTITTQQASGNSDNLAFKKTGALGPDNIRFILSHRTTGTQLWMYTYDGSSFANLQEWDGANRSVEFPPGGGTLFVDMATARVGIGTNGPATRLHVGGDVTVDGDIHIPPADRHLMLGPEDFIETFHGAEPRRSTILTDSRGSGSVSYYAPVHLPDGAEIVELRAWVLDNLSSGSEDILIRLQSLNPATQDRTTMAQVETTGSSTSIRTLSTNAITDPVLDNSSAAYRVLASWTSFDDDPFGSNIGVVGVRISYRVTSPLP